MDKTEIASIVAIVGMLLSGIGITGIDAGVLTGGINGLISVITLGAAVWSWYGHRNKNNLLAGIK